MYKFPMIFRVSTTTPSGAQTKWSTQTESNTAPLTCAIPPEFNGPGGGYSPEDLYALALANCFAATFKVFAQNSKLEYSNLHIAGELAVDRNGKGHPWMARMHLSIELTGVSNASLAERVLEKTKMGCLILNSVNTEKTFSLSIKGDS